MIKLQQIHKSYVMGETVYEALRGINLDIAKGECVSLVGASGSGKSTTMHIIGLLDRPTSGTYYLDGHNVAELSDNARADWRSRNIGFVFQSFFLLAQYTALDNICLPLQYQNVPRKEAVRRAEEMLEKVGLLTHKDHTPNELSGGQKQRVAIARALITKPSIILADEPTGALDETTGKQILQMLLDENKHNGTTVIIVTHDPQVAHKCERQIHIKDGLVFKDSSHYK